MANESLLEQRVAAIERVVADLQQQLAEVARPPSWLDEVIGSVTDAAAFREALEYGRAFRSADRPVEEADGPR